MKILGKVSLSFAVRILNDLLLVANVLTLIFLPCVLHYIYGLMKTTYLIEESYNFLLGFLYVCGVFTLLVLFAGHQIMRSLEKNLPFDSKNPRRFMILALAFFLLSAAFFGKMLFYGTILTIFCAYLFLLLTLLSLILAEVFRQACKIWEEHQLTI